jgi:hypothetical protein
MVVALILCALPILLAAERSEPDLRNTLHRAADYVVKYHEGLATVVAEEVYVQRLNRTSGTTPEERRLKSEFAIVRGEGDEPGFAIRDIREVDGQPVAERAAMDALLKAPHARLRSAAFALAVDQTKYNLGAVYRTINVPTLPLMFLLRDRQSRFRFRSEGSTTISGTPVHIVAYNERERPTIIRTPNGRSVVARGKLWINPSDGRVMKTELSTNEPRGLKAVITVTYEHDARLNLLVPTMMSESYTTENEQIAGTAKYSNFRRFQTAARIVQ